jgi:hypothetical protein
MLHPALAALLTETVTHEAFTGVQDAYGAPAFAGSVTHPARVEFTVRRIVDHTGQERMSRCKVFLDGDVTIDLRDRLVLPDGTAPPILALSSPRDLSGNVSHWEVSL